MRTMLLFSALTVLAACSDDRAVTGPNAGGSSRPVPAANGAPATAPQATLITSAGFTSVSNAVGPTQTVLGMPGSQSATSTATCPAGSFAIGGGVTVIRGGQKLKVLTSAPNDALTAWSVTAEWGGDMYNMSDYGEFKTTVICIQ